MLALDCNGAIILWALQMANERFHADSLGAQRLAPNPYNGIMVTMGGDL